MRRRVSEGRCVSDGDRESVSIPSSALAFSRDPEAMALQCLFMRSCVVVSSTEATRPSLHKVYRVQLVEYLARKRALAVHTIPSPGQDRTGKYIPEPEPLTNQLRPRSYLLPARILQQAHPLPSHVLPGAEVIR